MYVCIQFNCALIAMEIKDYINLMHMGKGIKLHSVLHCLIIMYAITITLQKLQSKLPSCLHITTYVSMVVWQQIIFRCFVLCFVIDFNIIHQFLLYVSYIATII